MIPPIYGTNCHKIHKPLCPASCNRRIFNDKEGISINIINPKKNKDIGTDFSSEVAPPPMNINQMNSCHHQNSERVARPEKLNAFLKPFLTAVVKDTIVH